MRFFFVVFDADPCQNSDCQGEDEKLTLVPPKVSKGKVAECTGGFGRKKAWTEVTGECGGVLRVARFNYRGREW